MKNIFSIGSIAVTSLALNLAPLQQAQAVNLVQNGGFTPTGTSVSAYIGNNNAANQRVSIANWTFSPNIYDTSGVTGYNYVVPDGTAFATNLEAKGNAPYGSLRLFSNPGQTVNSQADASGGAASGWYIAADAFFQRGAIKQTLTGLTPGQQYNVSFSQASAQQVGYTPPFSEYWQVDFGGSSQNSTAMASPGQQPVSAWQQQSLTFTADGASQVLSFLAQGTNDVPPFALLSGVSVEAVPSTVGSEPVPEPEDYVGTLVGLGFAATLLKSRLAQKKLAASD
jgi:hypothetical protein